VLLPFIVLRHVLVLLHVMLRLALLESCNQTQAFKA
jgi:hypothetical protein